MKFCKNIRWIFSRSNLQNLRIANTFFKHKPIHLTTWQSQIAYQNVRDSKTNKARENPYRNQIDYVLVRNNTRTLRVTDKKATIDRITSSDHKPVILYTKTIFPQTKAAQVPKQLDIHRLKNPETRAQYKALVDEKLNEYDPNNENIQEQWNSIAQILNDAAITTIGHKDRPIKDENPDIVMLSDMQRLVQKQLESTNDQNLISKLKTYRNRILTEIHREKERDENMKIRAIMNPLIDRQNENKKNI